MTEIVIDKSGFSATVSDVVEVGPFILIERNGSASPLWLPVAQLDDLIDLLREVKDKLDIVTEINV